jgi:hypothetical protein
MAIVELSVPIGEAAIRGLHIGDQVPAGRGDRFRVAGVGVAHDAQAGVGGQHALQARRAASACRRRRSPAGVQAVADAHPAAVVEAHPGGAAHGS